jgi:hypothetical protein
MMNAQAMSRANDAVAVQKPVIANAPASYPTDYLSALAYRINTVNTIIQPRDRSFEPIKWPVSPYVQVEHYRWLIRFGQNILLLFKSP